MVKKVHESDEKSTNFAIFVGFSEALKIPSFEFRSFHFYLIKWPIFSYFELWTSVKAKPVEILEQKLI